MGRRPKSWHVTADLLRDLEAGEIDGCAYLTLLLEHLGRLCPDCGAGVVGFLSGAEGLPVLCGEGAGCELAGEIAEAERESERMIEEAVDRALAFQVLEAGAAEAIEQILALPDHEARVRTIRADPDRFRNPALGELFLDRARIRVHDSPVEAGEIAALAEEVAILLPEGPYGTDFCRDRLAEARAHQANAVRAQGDLRRAQVLLREAFHLASDSVDSFLRAELFSFAASLARGQRRWPEALGHLDDAEGLFLEMDASFDLVARIRLQRASVLMLDGEPRVAADIVRGVIEELDYLDRRGRSERAGGSCFGVEAAEQLRFIARHNLVSYLCEAGDYREARDLMVQIGPLLAGHRERSFRLRARWLRGKIAYGLGELAAAEADLAAARDGFLAADLGLDAAIVALDLAILHAEQGRHGEVRRIATWTSRLFEAQDVHPEALAALGLFRQAALREALSAGEIRRVVRYLRSVRVAPPSRHQAAS
jgi:hypothetical protein